MSQRKVKWPSPKHTASQWWNQDQTPGLLATKSHARLTHSACTQVHLWLNFSDGYLHFGTSQPSQETQLLKGHSGLCYQKELVTCLVQSVMWQSVCNVTPVVHLKRLGNTCWRKGGGLAATLQVGSLFTSNFVSIEEKLVQYIILPQKSIDVQQRTILNGRTVIWCSCCMKHCFSQCNFSQL